MASHLFQELKKKYKHEENKSIAVTSGHNVYAIRNKQIEYLPTSKLRVGDYLILVPPKLPEVKLSCIHRLKNMLNRSKPTPQKGMI